MKRKPLLHGAICHAGGRSIEITSEHEAWLDWALHALYDQAERERAIIDSQRKESAT